MISLLRPLDVKLVFEDRPYCLGEVLNLLVEVYARGEVVVREGRVELVCEERFKEAHDVKLPANPAPIILGRGFTPSPNEFKIPKVSRVVAREYRESYVHSSVTFLTNTRLSSRTTYRYPVQLRIQPDPPLHAREGTVAWRLVTSLDIAHARSVTRKQAVTVILNQQPSLKANPNT